jgi:hypothetical protein
VQKKWCHSAGIGSDIVDVLLGGLAGNSTTNPYAGDDNLKGFSSGTFVTHFLVAAEIGSL